MSVDPRGLLLAKQPTFVGRIQIVDTSGCSSNDDLFPEQGQENTQVDTSKDRAWSPLWSLWKWELLACFLVLMTPCLIVATLYPHAGKTLPNWPFKVGINSVISLYGLLFKTLVGFLATSCVGQLQWPWFSSGKRSLYDVVRFDSAGRGAWGSLQWLYTYPTQQPIMALGALVLLLSTILDPIMQQLIRPVDCKSASTGTGQATLPRTNFLDHSDLPVDVSSDPNLVPILTSALNYHETSVEAHCPTGNCTFPVYSTIGYCSACQDSSADISIETACLAARSKNDTHLNRTKTPVTIDACPESSTYAVISRLSQRFYQLDEPPWNQITLNTTFNLAELLPGPEPDLGSSAEPFAKMELFKMAINNYLSSGAHLVTQTIMGKTSAGKNTVYTTNESSTNCDRAVSKESWRCRGYGAATCSLFPCVRTYKATVENGQLNEELVDQSEVPFLKPPHLVSSFERFFLSQLDTRCLSAEETNDLKIRGYNVDSRWLTYNVTMEDELFPSLLARGCIYSISNRFTELTREFLEGYFKGEPVEAGFIGYPSALIDGEMVRVGDILGVFGANDVVRNTYDFGRVEFEKVNSLFSNLSTTLTNYIRTHGNTSYSEDATGDVFQYATCVEVQWWWITFPAVLAALTLVFVALVVYSAETQHQPVWKSSPLAWMLHGPHESGQDGNLATLDEMEEHAKKVTISMN